MGPLNNKIEGPHFCNVLHVYHILGGFAVFDLNVFTVFYELLVVCVDRALFVGIFLVNNSLKFIEIKSIYIF